MTTSRSVLIGVVSALAVLVVGCSVYIGFTAGFDVGGGRAPEDASAAPYEPPVTSSEPPAPLPSTSEPLPSETDSPAREPMITDPPASPEDLGVEPTVMDHADGKACRTSSKVVAGGYPSATCRFWKKSQGLLSGEPLATGSQRIACQRDLDIENPVYTAKQSNSWWLWTTSDDDTWDWFPATAVAEGASDQPINGVALCE